MDEHDFATHHGLPEAVVCDRCGEQRARVTFSLFGSHRFVLESADEMGLRVHQRGDLEAAEVLSEAVERVQPDVTHAAQRVFHLCAACAEDERVKHRSVGIEPGWKDAFDRVWEAREPED